MVSIPGLLVGSRVVQKYATSATFLMLCSVFQSLQWYFILLGKPLLASQDSSNDIGYLRALVT
ncbi:hypothetical protein HanRHA438_Chr07g0289261 [Helianthus annuus]|nr:hypothetical protein HanRHA438_Chr07g0289261 [Helianthus annuus]